MSAIAEFLQSLLHPRDASQRRRHDEKTCQLDEVIKDVQKETNKLRDTITVMVDEMRGEKHRDDH